MSDIRRRRKGESKTKFREDCIEEDEDEDDDDGSGSDHRQHADTDGQNNKNRRKKKRENSEEKNNGEVLRRAKNLLLSPFRRLEHIYSVRKEKEKRKRKKKKERNPPPFPPYPEAIGKGCHLCFLQPRSIDSPPLPAAANAPESNSKPTARGNSSSYYDFLKSLLEKNDFYSPDCNVHQDMY